MMNLLQRAARWYLSRTLPRDLVGGDLCSVRSEDKFSVVKILSAGGEVVHVTLYKDKFDERPQSLNGPLSLGTIHDVDGFGVGHLPLSRATFASWQPVRFHHEMVTQDELIWVQEWEKSAGGVWT